MDLVVAVALMIVAAIGMEGVAWLTHKYVMHGFGWVLHEDHHHPRGRGLQLNDLYTLFFASISIALIAAGTFGGSLPALGAGIGVFLYGMGYLAFHDVMFHKRLRGVRIRPKGPYLQRIYDAHARHHQHPGKHDGVSFGFLYARPQKDS